MTDTQPESDSQFKLEHYLRKLTLEPMLHGRRAPLMPPPKCRSLMTPLVMRPGGYRNLRDIKSLNCLEDEATYFFKNFNCGNEEAIKALKLASQVPTEEVKKICLHNPYEVERNSSALFMIERGLITSVQQLVDTINPELNGLGFHTPSRCGNLSAQKVEPAYFCTLDSDGTMDAIKCVIIPLPPWEFAPQDFEDFTTMDGFEDSNIGLNGMNNDPPWCNADRMWAYVHDLCLMQDCHHFVLTTYEQSAFGAFSTYYTTGFVSRTIPFDAKPNSVLELFTYWVLTACRTENTLLMEKVPREKHFDPDVLEQERILCRKRFANDEHMAAGPNLETDDTRPRKRARKDPLEDRTGWEPLSQHADALFQSPTRACFQFSRSSQGSKSIAEGSNHEVWSDTEDDDDMLVRPCSRWNRWSKRKRDMEDKENPHEEYLGEHAEKDKFFDVAPKPATRPQFGHPIPCYSSDIDRNSGRFRPELIRFVSFPIPAPKS